MSTVGTPARPPLPGAKAPVVYVCQAVAVALAVHRTPTSESAESSKDDLHVLVRTAESQRGRSDTDWVLPRRWVGRPAELGSLAWRALEFSGTRSLHAPVGGAATVLDQASAVRPAGGLLSVVATVLLEYDKFLEPGWDWCPVNDVETVLGEWDCTAVGAARAKAREMLRDTDTALRLLPETFRLSDLRGVYEAHWGVKLDASNFARRALASSDQSFLEEVTQDQGRPGRPAMLYQRGEGKPPRLAPP